jgi:hypothetical protein
LILFYCVSNIDLAFYWLVLVYEGYLVVYWLTLVYGVGLDLDDIVGNICEFCHLSNWELILKA